MAEDVKYGLPERDYLWRNFIFTMVKPEHYERLFKHMRRSFYVDEPLNLITGYSEEKAKDMDKMILSYLPHELSFVVIDQSSNEIVGARITARHDRNQEVVPLNITSKEMQRILPFLDHVDNEAKIFEKYPQHDNYAELFMASVDREYRGQGIASEMYKVALELFKRKGFRLLKSIFTSPYTQKISKKLGFKQIISIKFNSYVNKKGEVEFPDAGDEELAVVGVLELP